MVKKLAIITFIFFVLPLKLYATEFKASVDNNQVGLGDNIRLRLVLTGAKAKSNPDVTYLQKQFTLTSQQQSSNTSIINGHMSRNTSWQFIIIPKNPGTLTIPAISIDTSQGILESQPIKITIDKASRAASSAISR